MFSFEASLILRRLLDATFIVLAFSALAFGQVSEREWDELFQREQGWLGADGVYSLDLSFNAETNAKADVNVSPGVLFWFSDTFVGTTKNQGQEYENRTMVNHSFAILDGFDPNPRKIEFFCSPPNQANAGNIIEGHYWLQDGIALNDKLWISAILVGKAWKPDRVDAVAIQLDPRTRRPDFSKISVDDSAPLSLKEKDAQLVWGAGVLDDAKDEYVYVYGYVDRFRQGSRKDLVVARVKRTRFQEYQEWEYYDGNKWSSDPKIAFHPRSTLVRNVSTEFSVSRIPQGIHKGKYLLVYTPGVIGNDLAFRIAESPVGPFSDERAFYRSKIQEKLPDVKCYNAKAHPIFTNDDGFLVSYNVNRLGDLARTPEEYRPRFVRLSWDEINARSFSQNRSGSSQEETERKNEERD